MNALALPRIGARVPRSIVPVTQQEYLAAFSQFLMAAGAFEESDIPQNWDNSFEACQAAMKSWIQRQIGPLQCLEPSFHMGVATTRQDVPPEEMSFFVQWSNRSRYQWNIGHRLEALSRLVPGLGAMVLHVLSLQSRLTYPLFLPYVALESASHLYWYGEDNEEIALAEQCEEDEAMREEMRNAMLTRADFKGAFPEWALDFPCRCKMETRARFLRRSIKKLTDPVAKQIATDALALSMLRFPVNYLEDFEGEYVGYAAVLPWSEDDLTVHVSNDLWEQAMGSEYCELIGEAEFPMSKPELFSEWQQDMRSHFEAIGLIDHLIHALSE